MSPPRVRNAVARHGALVAHGRTLRAISELWIMDPIDEAGGEWGTSAREVKTALRATKGGRVDVVINSPGGSLFEALAIRQALIDHPGQVTVRIHGLAASAATVIAMAGDLIEIAPGSMMMIHDASVMSYGNEAEHRSTADMLGGASAQLAEIYAARAGGTPAKWRAAMLDETWYTAQEAVAAGLADQVSEYRLQSPTAKAHLVMARRDPRHQVGVGAMVASAIRSAGLTPARRRPAALPNVNLGALVAAAVKDGLRR